MTLRDVDVRIANDTDLCRTSRYAEVQPKTSTNLPSPGVEAGLGTAPI